MFFPGVWSAEGLRRGRDDSDQRCWLPSQVNEGASKESQRFREIFPLTRHINIFLHR